MIDVRPATADEMILAFLRAEIDSPMPIEQSGFLASDAPWVAQIRAQQKPWFDLIEKLNRLAMSVLLRGDHP
jgi:hypothetical protein